MPLNYSFTGKRILVSGGASGIGLQLVKRFAEDGAMVFKIDKNAELLEKLTKEIPSVTAKVVDVSDWTAIRSVVASFGKINHLVNNAGIMTVQNFMYITKEASEKYVCSLKAADKLFPGSECYSAAKSGLVSLTRSMALELGPHKIHLNCILPGYVNTPMSQSFVDDTVSQVLLDKMIIKRQISTDEITDLVMLLLSPLSSIITGERKCY